MGLSHVLDERSIVALAPSHANPHTTAHLHASRVPHLPHHACLTSGSSHGGLMCATLPVTLRRLPEEAPAGQQGDGGSGAAQAARGGGQAAGACLGVVEDLGSHKP